MNEQSPIVIARRAPSTTKATCRASATTSRPRRSKARCRSARTRRSAAPTASMPSSSRARRSPHRARANERSWLYRMRPTVRHIWARWRRSTCRSSARAPTIGESRAAARRRCAGTRCRSRDEPLTFLTGMRTISTGGDVHTQTGFAIHVYAVTESMADEYFYNADGELLVVPRDRRAAPVHRVGAHRHRARRDRGRCRAASSSR